MSPSEASVRTNHPIPAVKWLPVLIVALFILLGLALIPYAGIENDEALFAGPLYADTHPEGNVRVAGQRVPLMLMTYLGTLKTAVYKPWFRRWRPGIWSMRVPVLLIGAVTIWLFYALLRRVTSIGAAVAGCALLATDATYLITTVYDWGPVALQHLLMVGGVLLLLSYAQQGSRARLFFGFMLFGLGMWDKALFAWTLSGATVATLVLFPKELRRLANRRSIGLAAAGFVVGALPLIIYNIKKPLITFGNAKFSTEGLANKMAVAEATLDSSAFFGFLAVEEWDEGPKREASNALERASLKLRGAIGERRKSWMVWALAAALACAPLWWRRPRPILFGVILMAVAWVQMLFTEGAGGGAHHVGLLWPWPHFVIAIAVASIGERLPKGWIVAGALTAAVCASSLLVTNQYVAHFIRHGSSNMWTDATLPLADYLRQYRSRRTVAMDWGIVDVIRMLDRGQTAMGNAEYTIAPGADGIALGRILEANPVIVAHVDGREMNAGVNERLRGLAVKLGYRKVVMDTIADRNGRPVFEVAEYRKVDGAGAGSAVR